MAHAEDFFLACQLVVDVSLHVVLVADLLEHLDDGLVGTAVQRSLEGTDGGGDGGVHIRQGGGRDACGEGGRVHAVVRVQNVGHIENVRLTGVRLLTLQQPQEVRGLVQIRADGRQVQPLANAVVVGGHHRQLRDEGEPDLLHLAGVLRAVVIHTEHGDGRAQGAHGARRLGSRLEEVQNGLRQLAVVAQALLQALQLLAVR